MTPQSYKSHKWLNFFHSVLILTGMGLILCLLGWLMAGKPGIFWSLFIGLMVVIITSRISPTAVLRMQNARFLHRSQAPRIHQVISELSRKAGLSSRPALFYIPGRAVNAFSMGQKEKAVIAMTDGMLRSLNFREIVGVLAHEISHIRNNDIWIMNLADAAGRVTSMLALTGQLLLLLNLPLLLMDEYHISWWIIAVLIFAPTVSAVMQLALSRTREFDADMDAAMLTVDPLGLAQALAKLEYSSGTWLDRILWTGKKSGLPTLLRTHPRTEDRIRRLIRLAEDIKEQPVTGPDRSFAVLPADLHPLRTGPVKRLLSRWFQVF